MNILKEAAVDYVALIKDKEVPIARKIAITWVLSIIPTFVAIVLWVLFLIGGFVAIGILGVLAMTIWAAWYIENR
jgi:hypothetical protein